MLRSRRQFLSAAGWSLLASRLHSDAGRSGLLRLPLRTRVEAFKGSGQWEEVRLLLSVPVKEAAVVICDMWDKHWCRPAGERVEALAWRMVPVIDEARSRGLLIVHSPSETMDFYAEFPQRRRMLELPKVSPPAEVEIREPSLPINANRRACELPEDKPRKAWSREIPAIRIAEPDLISDSGLEIYNLFRLRGIKYTVMIGVALNICVLERSFGIRQMTKWGIRCILVRDLTDSFYDPKEPPYVTHEQANELFVQHVEKYWCPSVLSAELVQALREFKAVGTS